jgi:hypothetical protein
MKIDTNKLNVSKKHLIAIACKRKSLTPTSLASLWGGW